MKTVEVKLYNFSELNEKAKRRAYENNNMNWDDCCNDEYRATLEEFERIFDIKVYNWEVGNVYGPTFRFVTAGAASEAPEGDPLRLAKYVWNNYSEYIMKGKYYSTRGTWIDGKYNYKKRHSKIIRSMEDCSLTGFCADIDILQPVLDCLHYHCMYTSYDELMEDCLTAFFQAWNADIEYHNSFEYFAETCDANEYYFTENGDLWKGGRVNNA